MGETKGARKDIKIMYQADVINCLRVHAYPNSSGIRVAFFAYPLGKDKHKKMDRWIFESIKIPAPRHNVSSRKGYLRDVVRVWKRALE